MENQSHVPSGGPTWDLASEEICCSLSCAMKYMFVNLKIEIAVCHKTHDISTGNECN